MILIHNFLWVFGIGFILMSVGFIIRQYSEKNKNQNFKIPKDAALLFVLGLIMFFISFYFPIMQ